MSIPYFQIQVDGFTSKARRQVVSTLHLGCCGEGTEEAQEEGEIYPASEEGSHQDAGSCLREKVLDEKEN